MPPSRVLVVHDAEHDATNDDGLFHAGLLSMISNSEQDRVTMVAAGADPSRSNLAAKAQVLQYTEQCHGHTRHPVTSDVEYLLHLPPGWKPKVRFAEIENTNGAGSVAELPPYLHFARLAAGTIPNENEETLINEINKGVIFCGHAPGYASFIKDMHTKGADFSRCDIIIQGASEDNQIASTYNDKDGWDSPEDRARYLDMFASVRIHDRTLANKVLQLKGDELEPLGAVFAAQGYRRDPQEYVNETICGPRSIAFVKTGAVVASRQAFAVNDLFWGQEGPYAPMIEKLQQRLVSIAMMCSHHTKSEFYQLITDELRCSSNPSVLSEIDQAATQQGINDLFTVIPECIYDKSAGPLAMRVVMMLHLASGYEVETSDDDKIVAFLKAHCTRTIFDPISLFIIHKILETEQSAQYELQEDSTTRNWEILSAIIPCSSSPDSSVVSILVKMLYNIKKTHTY